VDFRFAVDNYVAQSVVRHVWRFTTYP